jgi:hypothetical protein
LVVSVVIASACTTQRTHFVIIHRPSREDLLTSLTH